MMKAITKTTLGVALTLGAGILAIGNVQAGAGGNGNNGAGTEVTGQLVPPVGQVIQGTQPSIGWLINRPAGHSNNGHGNNVDGVDSSNPGKGGGGPNGAVDLSDGVDDEIGGGGDAGTNSAVGENQIIQTDGGIQMYIYSDEDEGSEASPFPVSGVGSRFVLYADIQGVLTEVAEMYLTGIAPTAAFVVATDDPWNGSAAAVVNGQDVTIGVYRTRADWSFSAAVTVGNLSTDPGDPLMTRQLDFFHQGDTAEFDWVEMDYLFEEGAEYTIASTIVNGGTGYSWSGFSRLTGFTNQIDKVGVETLQVQTIGGVVPDHLGQPVVVPPWKVGSASILVWPIASGKFTQMDLAGQNVVNFMPNQVFTQQVPNIFVNYRDLYPGSKTFVQVYKGAYVAGRVGMPILAVTEVPHDSSSDAELAVLLDDIAQNTVKEGIVVRDSDLQEHINYLGNGVYTLEILSGDLTWKAPGVYMSLGHISFEVNQNVSVRGQIGTK